MTIAWAPTLAIQPSAARLDLAELSTLVYSICDSNVETILWYYNVITRTTFIGVVSPVTKRGDDY